MLENTTAKLKVLAGAVGVNLALALGVSVGAVPQLGDDRAVRTAAVSEAVQEQAAPAARQPGDTADQAPQEQAPTTLAPTTTAPTTTVATPRTTTAATTKAPTGTKATQPAGPAVAAPAPVAVPVALVKVARRTPSPAEVNAAIAELKRQVGGLLLLVSPTPAQIDQVGDQVCTAFDNGQSLAQVKATALSMIPPSVTVTAATTDWAVRQAVTLYCPGHASKLV